MQCEKERIIQVSLSKITDFRRRRGGPALRRNLLVSHVLNNVLTKNDAAYQEYRTNVEIDMEVEMWDQDEQKPKALRESISATSTGGSITTGNRTESPNSLFSADETKELSKPTVCSIENAFTTRDKVRNKTCSDSAERDSNCKKSKRTPQHKETRVTGKKRSLYANEPCDNHVVCSKRSKYETSSEDENCSCDFPEPMDISSLVNVFSSSFAGLSGLSSRTSNTSYKPFHSFSPITSFPQTVEAF